MSDGVITEAVRAHPYDPSTAHWLPWRAEGCAIFAVRDYLKPEGDPQIGSMETEVIAQDAATAHNVALRSVQRDRRDKETPE